MSFIRSNMLRQHINYLFYYSFKRILPETFSLIHFINHIFHKMQHIAATFKLFILLFFENNFIRKFFSIHSIHHVFHTKQHIAATFKLFILLFF